MDVTWLTALCHSIQPARATVLCVITVDMRCQNYWIVNIIVVTFKEFVDWDFRGHVIVYIFPCIEMLWWSRNILLSWLKGGFSWNVSVKYFTLMRYEGRNILLSSCASSLMHVFFKVCQFYWNSLRVAPGLMVAAAAVSTAVLVPIPLPGPAAGPRPHGPPVEDDTLLGIDTGADRDVLDSAFRFRATTAKSRQILTNIDQLYVNIN